MKDVALMNVAAAPVIARRCVAPTRQISEDFDLLGLAGKRLVQIASSLRSSQ